MRYLYIHMIFFTDYLFCCYKLGALILWKYFKFFNLSFQVPKLCKDITKLLTSWTDGFIYYKYVITVKHTQQMLLCYESFIIWKFAIVMSSSNTERFTWAIYFTLKCFFSTHVPVKIGNSIVWSILCETLA